MKIQSVVKLGVQNKVAVAIESESKNFFSFYKGSELIERVLLEKGKHYLPVDFDGKEASVRVTYERLWSCAV